MSLDLERILNQKTLGYNQAASDRNFTKIKNAVDADEELINHLAASGCRVYKSVAQSIADSTEIALVFDAENFDTDNIHDLAINPSRLTCRKLGIYNICGNVTFATNDTGVRALSLKVNNALIAIVKLNTTTGGNSFSEIISSNYYLNIDDYVEIIVTHTAGSALNVVASSLSMVKVG